MSRHKAGISADLRGRIAEAGRAGKAKLGLALVLMASPSPLAAQVASQITPQSFAPPVQGGLGGGLNLGASPGLDTPAGADKLVVRLRGVRIAGGFPSLAGETDAIRARLSGRRVSGAEIFAAARELEAAYAKAGYVLVRVTLPKQQLVDGAELRLTVVDGYIERIETGALPDRVRARIAAVVAPLVGVHGIMLHEIERRILLAGDTPGVILSSALAPGSTLGATVLVVEAKYQPVNGILTADNTLARELGRYQLGIGADFNSVLGFGELVYLRATADPNGGQSGFLSDYPRNRTLAAGAIVPLGYDGLTFNLEGTLARTNPLPDLGLASSGATTNALSASDQFQRLSARLRYAWVRSRDLNVASQLVFDVQDERESLLAEPSSVGLFQDRLRILRVTNEANYLASWGGTFSGTITPSVGLDVLGARTAAQATTLLPLSTAGSDATFAKFEATAGYQQFLAEHLAFNLGAHGQTSFGSALARSEQIGLAGPGQLSSFDIGTLQGDSGIVGRAEVSAPYALGPLLDVIGFGRFGTPAIGLVASPYVFGAGGALFLSHPTALEAGHVRAASYGAGLRIGGAASGTLSSGEVTLEYGRQARSDNVPDGERFTLVSSIRF